MKIIAIDSSGLVASVAILKEDTILAQYSVDYKKTHSQTLLPMLAEITKMTEFEMNQVDAIAVAKGPGSFTGLRIGSATAKGLAFSLDKPIIEVPTLEAMAYQLFGYEGVICPMMDARRGQVYTGLYQYERVDGVSQFQVLSDQQAVSVEEIIAQVNERKKPVIYLGDGQAAYMEKIAQLTEVPYEVAPAFLGRQNAAALAVLAKKYYEQGRFVMSNEHRPDYLRLSQAERERMEKQNA